MEEATNEVFDPFECILKEQQKRSNQQKANAWIVKESQMSSFMKIQNGCSCSLSFSQQENIGEQWATHPFIFKEQLQTHPQVTNTWIVKRFLGYLVGNECWNESSRPCSSTARREHRLANFHLSLVVGQSVSSNEPIDSESQNGIPFGTDKENCVAHMRSNNSE